MTIDEIRKMHYKAEGRKEGVSIGETKWKAYFLLKQLIKKFEKLPEEYKKKISSLPADKLDVIGGDIFDLEKVEDLEKYF